MTSAAGKTSSHTVSFSKISNISKRNKDKSQKLSGCMVRGAEMEAALASLKGQMAALGLLNRTMWKKQLQKLPVMLFFIATCSAALMVQLTFD